VALRPQRGWADIEDATLEGLRYLVATTGCVPAARVELSGLVPRALM
jgi:hypothetical protein